MIGLIILGVFVTTTTVTGLAACKAAAPKTKEERYLEDLEQLRYLQKLKQDQQLQKK